MNCTCQQRCHLIQNTKLTFLSHFASD